MFLNCICPLREEFLFKILWYESVIYILWKQIYDHITGPLL